jgi:hypothetical protein
MPSWPNRQSERGFERPAHFRSHQWDDACATINFTTPIQTTTFHQSPNPSGVSTALSRYTTLLAFNLPPGGGG